MNHGRRLRATWDDGWSVAALVTVGATLLAFSLIAPGHHGPSDFAAAAAVVTAAVELFAALLLYVHWRLTGGRAGWLVLAFVAIAVQSLALAGLVFLVAIVVAVSTLDVAPAWIRVRLAVAMTFLGIGHAVTYPAPHGTVESTVAVLATLVGATTLLSLALTLLRVMWSDNRVALQTLSRRLDEAEAGARAEQARLHELRATVSGLGAASRLVHDEPSVSATHRRRLERMIDSELDRLQRLLNDAAAGPVAPVDIDAAIEPIVLRHRTHGYPIHWNPHGDRAIARADHIAEVINVLLENAIQHAGGAGATIETRRVDHVVEVVVSDSGPGVSRAIRSHLFEWGARGQDSHGQGIGLNVAQQLITGLGGYLLLIDSEAPGATFVLGLPAEEQP